MNCFLIYSLFAYLSKFKCQRNMNSLMMLDIIQLFTIKLFNRLHFVNKIFSLYLFLNCSKEISLEGNDGRVYKGYLPTSKNIQKVDYKPQIFKNTFCLIYIIYIELMLLIILVSDVSLMCINLIKIQVKKNPRGVIEL